MKIKIGDSYKLDIETLKKYVEAFEGFTVAFKKMAGNKKEYIVNYYAEGLRDPKSKLCKKCPLVKDCDFSMVDFEGDSLNAWCAKLFIKVE